MSETVTVSERAARKIGDILKSEPPGAMLRRIARVARRGHTRESARMDHRQVARCVE